MKCCNRSLTLKRLTIYTTLTLFSLHVCGLNNGVNFQPLSAELGHQQVTCIYKDSYGFVWIGTGDGLHKYNGNTIVTYEKSIHDSTTISHNTITTICEDNDRNIWVGTSKGLNLYDREKNHFVRYPMLNGYSVFDINDLFVDSDGRIWVCTFGNGITVFDPQTFETLALRHNEEDPRTLISNVTTCVVEDLSGNFWIGTREGLDFYNPETKKIKHFSHSTEKPECLSLNHITSLVVDDSNNLWIGTYGGGLNRLNTENQVCKFKTYKKGSSDESISNNHILALCKDRYDNLWIGTENGGLNYFDKKKDRFIHYKAELNQPNVLGSNSIWSVFVDEKDVVWVGTFNKGLYMYDKYFYKFNLVQHNPTEKSTLGNNSVSGFAEDDKKGLWIATDGGGINYFDLVNYEFSNRFDNNQLENKAVISIMQDSDDMVWASIWNGGAIKLNRKGEILKHYNIKSKITSQANIKCFYEDSQGTIWAGTIGDGLFQYDHENDRFIQFSRTSGSVGITESSYIYSILEDSRKNLWVGTLYGLFRINRDEKGWYQLKEFRHEDTDKSSISSYRIRALFEDSNGILWVGTENGLNRYSYESNSFSAFLEEDGLPSNIINGILEDNNHNLWISTNKGLVKFNPESRYVECFSKKDGLNSNMLNVQSCIKASTGEMFIGGNNGFNYFYPDSIEPNPFIPPVYITGIKLFNIPLKIGEKSPLKKNITLTKNIHFTWEQNSFTLEFAALNYTFPSRNQYQYKLEGFDDSWIQAGNRHTATYTNLDPGEYTFLVKGSNNDGNWNPTPTKLNITISPPVWKTLWAYLIYFVFAGTLLYAFVQLKIKQARQAENLKSEKIKREKEAEIHQLKTDFFANISHEIRTPLSLILMPLESIISRKKVHNGAVNQQLNRIYRNVKRMYELINELLIFTKSEALELKLRIEKDNIARFAEQIHNLFIDQAQNRNIDFKFIASEQPLEAWFDKNMMEKVITNLLSNAFKFTPDNGQIVLEIDVSTDDEDHSKSLVIRLVDNGMGIDPENIEKIFDRYFQSPSDETMYYAGSGIGLALVKNLVELHHGTITVESEKWKRTCFTIQMPLERSRFQSGDFFESSEEFGFENFGDTTWEDSQNSRDNRLPMILIAEDDDDFRAYMISLLENNYNLIEAENGQEAYQKAVEHSPNLIISDVRMPLLDGIGFCQKLKQDISTNHIPVVFLTSNTGTQNELEGIECGAEVYLTKPFNVEILLATVRKTIENRKLLYRKYSQEAFATLQQTDVNSVDKEFLQKIIDYVNDNIEDRNITVEKLASYMAMNRSNLYRKIKSLTGQTATEFIRLIRLKRAVKYLDEGKYNISEVAMKVGFDSPGYFTKCFKAQFNKLPSELSSVK